MVIGCISDAVKEYHKHLANGKTPHIIWTNSHAYVITEEDFPERIYCHDGDPNTTSELIKKILNDSDFNEYGEVADHLYKNFRDEVLKD